MTAYAQYTAQALHRYPFGEVHQVATQVDNGGDVIQLADGRIGVVQGVGGGNDAVAIGDMETLRTVGTYQFPAATSLVLANGSKAYWDPVALQIVAAGGNANGSYYAGLLVMAKVSGVATILVDINAVSPAQGTVDVATVAAQGTNQATAAQVGGGFVLVTGGNSSAGVILTAEQTVKLKNGANAPLFVYPPVGAQINGLAANTALNVSTNQAAAEFVAFNATQFYTVPLVPS
jgi:hypothetical protein